MPARVTITAFVVIFPLLISTAWAVELAFGWGDMEGGKGRQQGCGAVCWWRWLETAATCSAWAEPGQRPAVRGPGLQLRRPRTATEGAPGTQSLRVLAGTQTCLRPSAWPWAGGPGAARGASTPTSAARPPR